jgi:hypothetical protein
MRGPCRDCSHYRPAKPPSELLARATASNDSAVLAALGKIQDDEKELDGQEDLLRARLELRGQKTWDARPMMSSCCGIDEGAGVFFIAEIRNAELSCTTFSTAQDLAHDCSTCAHRVVPSRLLEDLDQEQAYAALSTSKTAMGHSASMIENLWKEHLQGAGNRRANEIRDVYQRKGLLPSAPDYLDYCGHLSRDRHFVVCALQNPHGTCGFWSDTSTSSNDAQASTSRGVTAQGKPSADQTAKAPLPAPRRRAPVFVDTPQRPRSQRVERARNRVPDDESGVEGLKREIAEAQARGDHGLAAKLQVHLQNEMHNETARMELESNIEDTYHKMRMKVIDNTK